MNHAAGNRTWYRDATPRQWNVLFAAMLGWALDGMDIMLYAFALTTIQREFGFTSATAGALASVTLLGSALGGFIFGYIADRFGRVRALIYSILAYSIFTAATAFSHSLAELVLWRFLVGIGLGGEWAAGSVLVSEVWPAEHRGKAIGIVQSGWAFGYIAAAILAATIIPVYGWRVLFLVGVAPALFTLWVRRRVQEPELWIQTQAARNEDAELSPLNLFRVPLARRTMIAILLSSCVMFAYWGLFTWVPAYLASPVGQGGAGMSMVRSTPWIIAMQVGAFLGYVSFGFFGDRFGRRPAFSLFMVGAAICVPAYALSGRSELVLLALGPLVGFFGHGYFSVFGAMLSELFPSRVRGVAQGVCYNTGRGVSVLAPMTIGFIADRSGIGVAIACTSILYLAGAGIIYALPETKGTHLA